MWINRLHLTIINVFAYLYLIYPYYEVHHFSLVKTFLFILLVNRFRCPKGWKRLGGSCYYLSNLTSTSTNVNYTCNFLHSNLSNLIQIRNAVELFYATHVLLRNNWSSLMINIHPNLLKGKKNVFSLRWK
jgi:hypothetical protein